MAAWYMAGPSRATMVEPLGPEADEVVRADLARMKECGLNAVRGWIDWTTAEPEPGRYDFEAVDRLLRHAGELGLKVILQLYLDSAPDWLLQAFPDSRYVSQGGQAIDSQGSPGFCYDHPGVRQAAERFMQAVASRVRAHPAFYAYDVWSEPHVVQWAYFDYLPQPALFCYCHYSKQRFRRWLKARYGDLERLNRAWYRRFPSWEAVEPPRFISLMTYTDFIDWQRFTVDKIARDLAWRTSTVKAVDPDHLVASHSAVPPVMTIPLLEQGEPDDWQVVHSVDVWGTSFYPKHVGAAETAEPAVRGAYLDSTRSACASAGRAFWLGEVQGGHGYVGTFAQAATAADIAAWAWGPISHGAKGLCFYAWRPMSRGYESAGFGLTRPDGSPTDRSRAAGEVARLVDGHAELFLAARVPQAEAAILWNNDANILWGCLREKSPYVPSRALLGAYRALFEHHFPVDFVHPDQLAALARAGAPPAASGTPAAAPGVRPLPLPPGPEPVDVRRYRVVYLPFAIMVRRDVAAGLAAFVGAGGTVVAEARTGWNDEFGRVDEAVPGCGLRELFGAQESWTSGSGAASDRSELEISPQALAAAFGWTVPGFDVGRVTGAFYRQALEPLDATVAGHWRSGEPALTVRRAAAPGAGVAVLVGSWLSYAYHLHRDPATGRFLAAFARAAGVQRPVEVEGPCGEPGELEARMLVGHTREHGPFHLLFAFNHGRQVLAPELRLRLDVPGHRFDLLELAGGQRHFTAERGADGRVVYRARLEPESAVVVRITPA